VKPREFQSNGALSILVMRLYFIGDVLFTTPVLQALRERFHDSSIAVLIKKRARGILEGNPNVDEILEYDAVERYHSPLWLSRLALDLRRRRFDVAVDLTGDLRSSWLLLAADPGFRVGLNHAGMGWLLDRRIPYASEGHIVEHLLSAVEPLGATTSDAAPSLYITDGERAAAAALLGDNGVDASAPFVVLSPGANGAFRRWPLGRFGLLARAILNRLGAVSVVTGSPSDAGIASEVVSASKNAAVSLAGKTSVRELAALCTLARGFVGNDSAPLHIAAAVGTPVVGLFGPSTPERVAPRGAPSRVLWSGYACSPCQQRSCERERDPCMSAIGVDEVFAALRSLIEGGVQS
jgi:lipopolysaccharide heptosyltransferase II